MSPRDPQTENQALSKLVEPSPVSRPEDGGNLQHGPTQKDETRGNDGQQEHAQAIPVAKQIPPSLTDCDEVQTNAHDNGPQYRNSVEFKPSSFREWAQLVVTTLAMGGAVALAVISQCQLRTLTRQREAMDAQVSVMRMTLVEVVRADSFQEDETRKQSGIMDSSLAETRKAGITQLSEMRRQVDLIDSTLAETKKVDISQLRAYVAVRVDSIRGLRENETLTAFFHYVNFGRTHASNFDMRAAVALCPYPLPNDYALPPTYGYPDAFGKGVIIPEEQAPIEKHRHGSCYARDFECLTPEEKKEAQNPLTGRKVYFYGMATYFDIFGRTDTTEYFYMLYPRHHKPTVAGGDSVQFWPVNVAGRAFVH